MDYLCLFFCLRMQRQEVHTLRLCIGAVIGAAYAVANVALGFLIAPIIRVLIAVIFAFLCCYVAMPACPRKYLRVLTTVPLFFTFEAALGGIMTAAYHWLGDRLGTYTSSSGGDEKGIGIPLFFLIIALTAFLFLVFYRVIFARREEEFTNEDVRLLVKYHGKTAIFPCFFDSGNLAKEPISGEAVIFLPKNAQETLSIQDDLLASGSILGSRLIPIQTLTSKELLWGIFPDEQYLLYDSRSKRVSAYLVFSDNGKTNAAILPQTERFTTFGY